MQAEQPRQSRTRTKFLRVAPSVYRYFEIGPDGKKRKGVGSYFAYYWRGSHQVKATLDTEDLKEASAKMRKLRAEQDRLDPNLRTLTLANACDNYLAGRKNLSESQRRLDAEFVRRIKETFPDGPTQPLRHIKTSDCESFVANLRKLDQYRKPTDQPLSVSLRNQIGGALKGIFELAVLDGAIPSNPAGRIKYRRRPEPKRLTPTWHEFLRIVEKVRGEPLADTSDDSADWLEFSGRAGLGTAEINALTWSDIDFDKGRMWVRRKKTSTNFLYTLHPLVIPFLKNLKAKRNPKPSDKVFRVLVPKVAFANACKSLGLPPYELRALRRCHITYCLESGVPADVVAQNQGHRDGGRLVRMVYYSLRPEFVKSEFAKLKEPNR